MNDSVFNVPIKNLEPKHNFVKPIINSNITDALYTYKWGLTKLDNPKPCSFRNVLEIFTNWNLAEVWSFQINLIFKHFIDTIWLTKINHQIQHYVYNCEMIYLYCKYKMILLSSQSEPVQIKSHNQISHLEAKNLYSCQSNQNWQKF